MLKNCQQGFNLIELMVAMALSSMLMLTLIVLFFTVKRIELVHHELISILDNGRYAVYILRKELSNKAIQFSIQKKGLYIKRGQKRRQIVSYNIYKLQTTPKHITFWIQSDNKKIKRQWEFSV